MTTIEAAARQAVSPRGAPTTFRIVSVNPDLVGRGGHYNGYDRQLANVARHADGQLLSLASRVAPPGLGDTVVPVFSDESKAPLALPRGSVKRFTDELREALGGVAQEAPSSPTAVMMYTATAWHIGPMVELAREHAARPWVFLVNLFHLHEELLRADHRPEAAPPLCSQVIGASRTARGELPVHLFADSDRLRDALARWTGEDVAPWPMFSTTLLPSLAPTVAAPMEGGRVRVYAPGTVSLSKGYDLLAELAQHRSPAERSAYDLTTRTIVTEDTPTRLRQAARTVSEHTFVLEGVMTDDEYVGALQNADVILIPYRWFPFASRTSAVFSDAISLGTPVVAARGTWAGAWTTQLGVGETFRDGDVDDMRRAVLLVCRHLEHYRSRAYRAAPHWRQQNDPKILLSLIQGRLVESSAKQSPFPPEEVLAMRNRLRILEESGAAPPRQAGAMAPDASSRHTLVRRALLRLLRVARKKERSRQAARRAYAAIPSALRKRVDDLVRRHPG